MTILYTPPVRRLTRAKGSDDLETLLNREWLVTNGLGGYASGTIAGIATRRYHGVLVASLYNPLGRTVMLNQLLESARLPDGSLQMLSGIEREGRTPEAPARDTLVEFRLEGGLPVWRFELPHAVLEKRVVMPYRQNTVLVTFDVLEGDDVELELRPAIHFRSYEAPVTMDVAEGYELLDDAGHYVVQGPYAGPPLRMLPMGVTTSLELASQRLGELLYRVEAHRGYEYKGELWSPGVFRVRASTSRGASLLASTEPFERMTALPPVEAWHAEHERRRRLLEVALPEARAETAAELTLAADQFVITPAGRVADTARAWAVGDEIRTIIAGYHWFTDWGRDTMISLEGLTLVTGRYREAGAILRAFAQHVQDGLIPNMFPDGSDKGLYHTADATLWFFHALARFHQYTGDTTIVAHLLPVMEGIARAHLAGTRFGIGVDPADGLVRQGAEGYQLTWMDAKVDGWVVTPRRGKAVEINALWYNALRHLEGWLRDVGRDVAADEFAAHARRAHASFNARFWSPELGYCLDVVDGPDGDSAECRPNQLFAISLDHPVLERDRWESVVRVAEQRLLTPVGLRSLAPGEKNYHAKYWGDLRTRDGAYHQGTVWGWLIGPWVDAWLKLYPEEQARAREYLLPLVDHLDDFGVGSVAEIFDAEAPYTPRGCVAQAWSVAELLRCWVRTSAR